MAYYNLAELVITDGTELIDLLNHFNLAEWQPDVLKYRDGGIFQDSPLTDGRRLVQKYYSNLVEQFTLAVRAGHMDSAISDLRRLRQLMEKAAGYWDESQDTPVWIEARGTSETNRRYSILISWSYDKDPNPYAMPFAGTLQTLGIVQLGIEHSFWTDQKPEAFALTPISTVRTGVASYGNVDGVEDRLEVTNGGCFVANSDPVHSSSSYVNQITAVIFATGVLPPVYVSNAQVVPALWPAPVQLMPNTLTILDGLYFATSITDDPTSRFFSVPFYNLIFDISTPGTNYSYQWYYTRDDGMGGYNWDTLVVNDQTNGLQTAGVHAVMWEMPVDWVKAQLMGDADAAYWVRLGITGVAGGGTQTGPYQQNRNVYTTNWPYVEIQANTIEGDIPAIMSMKTYTPTLVSNQMGGYPELTAAPYRFLASLYSQAFDYVGVNSQNFSPFIGLSDGSTPSPTSQAYSSYIEDSQYTQAIQTPYINAQVYDTAVSGTTCRVTIDTESALLLNTRSRWYGRFKVFLRYGQDGAPTGASADYFTAQLRAGGAGNLGATSGTPDKAVTDVVPLPGVLNWSIAELGAIDTRGNSKRSETGVTFYIDLTASGDAVTALAKLYLFDLILMPIDEWSADISVDSSITFGALCVDAIIFPRRGLRGAATNYDQGGWNVPPFASSPVGVFSGNNAARISSSGNPILQKQIYQRVYFLAISYPQAANNNALVSYPNTTTEVGLYHVQRYHSMRGKS